MEVKNKVPFSIEMDLDDGEHVTYDNVVSFTVEENPAESPDEVPEEGDPDREGNEEVDMSTEDKNPMDEEEEEQSK